LYALHDFETTLRNTLLGLLVIDSGSANKQSTFELQFKEATIQVFSHYEEKYESDWLKIEQNARI
jgi:hypothetical protein